MLSLSIPAMAKRTLPLALYCLLAASLVSTQTTSASSASGSAAATTGSAAASSGTASSSSREPITHTIDVAKGGFTFTPDVVQAVPGDTIRFLFFPTNHSVVRAEYKYPCIPYEDTGVEKVGFFSGFKPVDAIISDPPTFDLLINDTKPIFYYCSAPGSCINYGMVGVINPNATVSLTTQRQLAKDSEYMLQPGENFPSEGEDPFASGSASASGEAYPTSSSSSTAAAATTSGAAASGSHHGGLSSGATAGIAVGSAIVGLMVAALFFLWVRNKALKRRMRENEATRQGPQGPEASERGSHFYGAPSSHMSQQYDPAKHGQDRTSYVSSAYSPGLPQYAPNQNMPPIPSEHAMSEGMLSPGPGSPLVRPTSPGDRNMTGYSTPPAELHEKPASGPHELAASLSRAKKRFSGRDRDST